MIDARSDVKPVLTDHFDLGNQAFQGPQQRDRSSRRSRTVGRGCPPPLAHEEGDDASAALRNQERVDARSNETLESSRARHTILEPCLDDDQHVRAMVTEGRKQGRFHEDAMAHASPLQEPALGAWDTEGAEAVEGSSSVNGCWSSNEVADRRECPLREQGTTR